MEIGDDPAGCYSGDLRMHIVPRDTARGLDGKRTGGETGIVGGWAILEGWVQPRGGLRSFRGTAQRWCGSRWDWEYLCAESG